MWQKNVHSILFLWTPSSDFDTWNIPNGKYLATVIWVILQTLKYIQGDLSVFQRRLIFLYVVKSCPIWLKPYIMLSTKAQYPMLHYFVTITIMGQLSTFFAQVASVCFFRDRFPLRVLAEVPEYPDVNSFLPNWEYWNIKYIVKHNIFYKKHLP